MSNDRGRERLSVGVITLNEEEAIGPCLESVRWADEIIVCDSGSSDKTLAIARQYTDRVYVDEWRGFSGHKNLCLDRATSPWYLSLDADERVSPELRDRIQAVLADPAALDGYAVPRRNFFLGREIRRCGWYPDRSIRLFRRERGRFGARAVHEGVEVQGRVGTLDEPLLHYTYSSLREYLERMNRYSTMAALELRDSGRRFRAWDLLARPPATFARMYVLQGGLLEGWRGLLLSVLYAFYTFAKYAKLWELSRGPDTDRHVV